METWKGTVRKNATASPSESRYVVSSISKTRNKWTENEMKEEKNAHSTHTISTNSVDKKTQIMK